MPGPVFFYLHLLHDVTFHRMKTKLLKIISETEDSIRFYKLPDGKDQQVE